MNNYNMTNPTIENIKKAIENAETALFISKVTETKLSKIDYCDLSILVDLVQSKLLVANCKNDNITSEQKDILLKAIKSYGVEKQSMVAMEECAELIQAISKTYRTSVRSNLIEEIADVTIMIEQLKLMYKINNSLINLMVTNKIRRLSERMENDEV